MRVLNTTASAGLTTDRVAISQLCQEIVIEISKAAATPAEMALTAMNETIFVAINSKKGQQLTSIPNIKLSHLGFFAQHGEGIVTRYARAGANRVAVVIKLAPALGIDLSADENMEFSIANMRPGFTYEVYAKPADVAGTNILEYANRNVNQGQTNAKFGASTLSGLILPNTAELVSVSVQNANAVVKLLTPLELMNENANENDLVEAGLGAFTTSYDCGFLWLPLQDATSVEVNTTGAAYQFVSVQVKARG